VKRMATRCIPQGQNSAHGKAPCILKLLVLVERGLVVRSSVGTHWTGDGPGRSVASQGAAGCKPVVFGMSRAEL
jgi:hypothetical protein